MPSTIARGRLLPMSNFAAFLNWKAVELPYGRKRALEIATTLALDPEMLLLDEPTAGMGHEDIDRISALIKAAAANRTVLMVEHNLSVVANISDHITVLTRGRVLAEGIIKRYPTILKCAKPIWALVMAKPLLTVERLEAWYGESHILHGVNFQVFAGEVVTLLGRNGAGKTTTLKSIMGMVERRKGAVRFEEQGAHRPHLRSDRTSRSRFLS